MTFTWRDTIMVLGKSARWYFVTVCLLALQLRG
jgi:hypothetical protein